MNREETFNQLRPLLFSIAYRMLGSVMDAEDVLQEAFLRWYRQPEEDIQSPKAFLTTIVTRLAIDQLRSARAKREVYVGMWLPEPVLTEPPASERTEMADSLSTAFLVLLESLTPNERAAFLLREIFGYDYAEVAHILDKSEANCRQMVRRAQQHLSERRPRFEVSPQQQENLTRQFMQACTTGNMNGLLALLTDDVVSRSDGGGKIAAARKPLYGPDRVARFLMGLVSKASQYFPGQLSFEFAWVNQQPGIVTAVNGQVVNVMTLDVTSDHIRGFDLVANPDKLQAVQKEMVKETEKG